MENLTVSTQDMFTYDELYDTLTRRIAQELAHALNQNSVDKIREIKYQYRECKEFVKAKKVIEMKCKQIWNVFDNKDVNIPYEAMKVLGVTNRPSLEFLLDDSVKYFEKTDGSMTVHIIENILRNKQLEYTIEDIHKYLQNKNKKDNCKYNSKTIEYLVKKHNYDRKKLKELGVTPQEIDKKLSLEIKTQKICSELAKVLPRNPFKMKS